MRSQAHITFSPHGEHLAVLNHPYADLPPRRLRGMTRIAPRRIALYTNPYISHYLRRPGQLHTFAAWRASSTLNHSYAGEGYIVVAHLAGTPK
jgi:hypothetical protein